MYFVVIHVPSSCFKKSHFLFCFFVGHELLYKEVLYNTNSTGPQNYTRTFTYVDKDDELVSFAKFQIDDVSKFNFKIFLFFCVYILIVTISLLVCCLLLSYYSVHVSI